MNFIRVLGTLACILCLGQALIPASSAQVPAKAAANPGYEYQFSRTVHGQEAQGAPHASEIPFIFGTLPVWQQMRKYNESEQQYAMLMQQYLTNFAKTGDPNGGSLVKWPKFDGTKRAYVDFTDTGPVAKESLRRQICDVFMENEKRTSAK